jgi:hypothetical protein
LTDVPYDPIETGEEVARTVERSATVIREILDETAARGARINAHMADAASREIRSGRMMVREAIDLVLANPEQYRFGRQITSPEELEGTTLDSFQELERQLGRLAAKLRPEVAVSFAPAERALLLAAVEPPLMALQIYRIALVSGVAPDQPMLANVTPSDRPEGD